MMVRVLIKGVCGLMMFCAKVKLAVALFVVATVVGGGGLFTVPNLTAAEAETVPASAEKRELHPNTVLNIGDYWRYFLTARKVVCRKEGNLEVFTRKLENYQGYDSPLPQAEWTGVDFDDGSWRRMRGPFFPHHKGHAYDPAVDYKGIRFYDGSSAGMALLCARGRFEVADPKATGDLTLSVTYRGGVVVYLNGKEVARGHLPDADKKGLEAVAEDYPPEAFVDAWDGGGCKANLDKLEKRIRCLTEVKIPSSALLKGVNVLAVEVHRAPYTQQGLKSVGMMSEWSTMGLIGVDLKASTGIAPAKMASGLQAWAQDPTVKARWSDVKDPFEPVKPMRIAGARNGTFSGQMIISSDKQVNGLSVQVSELKGAGMLPAEAVQVRYMTQNDEQMMEALDPAIPSPLMKRINHIHGAIDIDRAKVQAMPGILQPVVLTVAVPRDAKPGEYKGVVTVSAEGEKTISIPVELTIAGLELPAPQDFLTEVGMFESAESVALKYNVELWSEKHWQLLDRTFALMGQVGADHVYILLKRRLHFGNSQSMVRWIRKDDGGYSHDFSIVEKYLDLALKHLGKIAVVGVVAWDQSDGWYGYATEKPGVPKHGARYTIVDPKTGKIEDGEGPTFGTPEAQEFWKPVYDGIAKILKARGLEKSMMHGVFGDRIANKECVEDLRALAPGVKWISQNHPGPRPEVFGMKQDEWLGAAAHVYIGRTTPDPSEGKRRYGWQAKNRAACFPRGLGNTTSLSEYRFALENFMVKGLQGLARTAFDWYDLPGDMQKKEGYTEYGGRTICNRYPENDWVQTSIIVAATRWAAPGRDGPLSTMRLEMFRQGAQEAEARILIEKALIDPEKKAKIGEALTKKAQDVLDRRQLYMAVVKASSHFEAESPGRLAEELYLVASEVADKAGN